MHETSAGPPGWYRSFLEAVILANDGLFAWLTQVGELAIGLALIGAALLAINAHYATAGHSPIGIGGDSFDEAVDLDTLMTAIEVVLGVVALRAARRLRSHPEESRAG